MLYTGDPMQKRSLTIGLIILFIALLRYGSLNYEQSAKALTLWFETLVPSLFTVMVMVKVMFAFGVFDWMARPFAILFSRLFQMNKQSFSYLLALMFLGFPAGAAFINQAVADQRLSQKEGRRLVYTCSFATPGFVILTLGSVLFHNVMIGVLLFLIQLGSGWILLLFTRRQPILAAAPMDVEHGSWIQTLGSAMMDSGKTLYMMGGYLMLCMSLTSIVLQFLPACLEMPLRMIAEFSSGTMQLAALNMPLAARLITISMLLSFGGFCVHMQVICFSEATCLRYRHYLWFRVLQALIAGILAYAVFGMWLMV